MDITYSYIYFKKYYKIFNFWLYYFHIDNYFLCITFTDNCYKEEELSRKKNYRKGNEYRICFSI